MVWRLPPAARALVVAVLVGYAALCAWGACTVDLTLRQAVTEAVFAGAGVVSVDVSIRLAWPRTRQDRLSRDFLGVWMLPVALLLPPPFALVVVVVPTSFLQLRGAQFQPVKVAYNIASLGMAYAAAALAHQAVVGGGRHTVHDLIGGPRQFVALLAAFAAWWAVNHLLIAGIVALTAGADAVRAFLRDHDGLIVDVVDMAVGTIAAVLWATNPVSVLLLVPPVLLMQHQLFSGLRHAVRTDLLTEVASPQFWRETAAREIERASASGANVAVLMIDVDHFKSVNDRYGHLAGDEVLAAVARTISKALRPGDLIGRLGGEEFGAILAGLNLLDAEGAAERLRAQVAEVRVRSDRGEWIGVTVSVGVAELSVNGGDLTRLLDAADIALYAAKSAGRNRVRVAGPRPGQVIDLRTGAARSVDLDAGR
jgi:diguanylate cyclase (GGDEF)-like protein